MVNSTADRVLVGGSRGGGKVISYPDGEILTPFGFKKNKDLKVGELINNPDGSVCKLIQLHPIVKLPTWRVHFHDKTYTDVAEEHLWLAWRSNKSRKYKNKLISGEKSAEVIETKTLKKWVDRARKQKEEGQKWIEHPLIPVCQEQAFNVNSYGELIDPYLLGVLLGDGCITKRISITSMDSKEIEDTLNKLDIDYSVTQKENNKAKSYSFIGEGFLKYRDLLKRDGLLGTKSHTKFIPRKYKLSSLENRYAIIQGLMDTDGTVDKGGRVTYCSVSKTLADDVAFVLRSLGATVTTTLKNTYYTKGEEKVSGKNAYNLYIKHRQPEKLFSLKRKKDRAGDWKADLMHKRVVDVEILEENEGRCITVSHPNGLYITNDFIVTHNSFALVWLASQKPREWHYTHYGKTISEHEAKKLVAQGKTPKYHVDKISTDDPDYVGIILRRFHPEFVKNLFPICEEIYIRRQGARWVERNKVFIFPSGAKIFAGHCKDRNALAGFLGGNYDFGAIDEANQFPWPWIEKIDASIRSKKFDPQLFMSTNPGGVSHYDIREKFIARCPPVTVKERYSELYDETYEEKKAGPPFEDENGLLWQFVPGSVFDNPHLLNGDPRYVRKLQGLSGALRAQWLHGDWDSAQGMYFDNFDELHHVIYEEDFVYGKHFTVNSHKLYMGIDYGTHAPFVCALIAVDKDDNAIVFDEIVATGLSATQQAKLIKQTLHDKYELTVKDFSACYCDPSMFAKTQGGSNYLRSVASFYNDEGIYLLRGNNDRKLGAKVFYELLTIPEQLTDGAEEDYIPPILRFSSNCVYGVKSIPTIPSKELDPEDVDTLSEDHFYDAVRYAAMETIAGKVLGEIPQKKKGWRSKIGVGNEEEARSWITL